MLDYEKTPDRFVTKLLIFVIVMLVFALVAVILTNDEEQRILEATVSENLVQRNKIVSRDIKISDSEIQVLPTSLDEIYNNSTWCGTFQLAWNDLLDEIAKDGTIESSNIEIVDNLNKKSFIRDNLSESAYYKNLGLKTQNLREDIIDSIKGRFDQSSDSLDILDWNNDNLNDPKDANISRYLLYVILNKEFKFENEFKTLNTERFGSTVNVHYFGIDSDTSNEVRKQVEVLYYDSEGTYAVSLKTSENDEIILVKNSTKTTFEEIFNEVENKKDAYSGEKTFGVNDTLKVPVLNFNLVKQYEELSKLEFTTNKDITGIIQDSVQVIQIKLDNTGATVESKEAKETQQTSESREFAFNDEFTMFVREKGKEKPYLAANISNISLFLK